MDKINILKCWVDAPYAMHPDFCSHTVVTMFLGWILVASMSKIKKSKFKKLNRGGTDRGR